jgi:hypothetical protein
MPLNIRRVARSKVLKRWFTCPLRKQCTLKGAASSPDKVRQQDWPTNRGDEAEKSRNNRKLAKSQTDPGNCEWKQCD